MKTAEQIAEILFAHTTNNLATYADVIREAQLEAMKEGMRMAADEVAGHWNSRDTMINQSEQAMRSSHALIKASEQLTIKDLEV